MMIFEGSETETLTWSFVDEVEFQAEPQQEPEPLPYDHQEPQAEPAKQAEESKPYQGDNPENIDRGINEDADNRKQAEPKPQAEPQPVEDSFTESDPDPAGESQQADGPQSQQSEDGITVEAVQHRTGATERTAVDHKTVVEGIIENRKYCDDLGHMKEDAGRCRHAIDKLVPRSNQLLNKVRQALRNDQMSRTKRHQEEGDIDFRRLADIGSMSDVVSCYKKTTKGQTLNAALQIYVDVSGSMDGGYMLETASAASVCISKALQSLRVPHQVIEFTSRSKVVKDWKGKIEDCRMEDAGTTGGTHAPRALCYGVPSLLKRREGRKIILVLTDGDLGSGYNRKDKFYSIGGILDTWRRRDGVEFYAIGLGVQCVASDPKRPSKPYNYDDETGQVFQPVGIGKRVTHYKRKSDADNNYRGRKAVGLDGGIDNVTSKNLIEKLSKHLVEVLTEGRQVVR